MLDLDFKAALRSLARSPGFLATTVISLALGLGAAASAFGVIDAVRFRALPFKDADRLVIISEVPADQQGPCRANCIVSYVTYANVLRVIPLRTLDATEAYGFGAKSLDNGDQPRLVFGGITSPGLFGLLGVRPELGRAIQQEDDRLGAPPVLVLSHDLWVSQYGSDPGILGKAIKLSDSHYTVIGVMPAGFDYEVGSQFWLPVVPILDPSTHPTIRTITVLGRLAPGRTLAQLNAELKAIDPAALVAAGSSAAPTRLQAAPLRDRYTSSTESHDLIFAGIVACVLLIACANVANLALVRALHRQREFALRAALGAQPARIARGLWVQHTVIALIAGGLGLGFAAWFLRTLQSLAVLQSLRPSGMEYRLDARVMEFTLVLALLVGGLLGLVSARVAGRSNLQRLLREGAPSAGGGRWGSRAQKLFVVAQVASAVVLLTGAGLLTRTAFHLAALDLGFNPAHVAQGTPSIPHPWRVKEKYVPVIRQIAAELAQLPGVAATGLRAEVPIGSSGPASPVAVEGQTAPLSKTLSPASTFSVSPGYFRALGVTVVSGREFSEQDAENAPQVAVINEWAARHWWPRENPVGRTIRIDTAPSLPMAVTVVGVVRDNKAAQQNLLLAELGPEIYRPWEQAPAYAVSFFIRATGSADLALKPMREVLVRLVPDRPLFASLLSDQVRDQLGGVRLNALQIAGFALVGLFLSLTGIYGVLAYTVGRRTHEIGIRGALGASRGGIERMVLGDAARLTGAGVLIGIPVALYSTRLIQGMLYGVSATDPMVYVVVSIGVALVSLVAAYAPARRAAKVDPVIALKAG